MIVAVTAPTEQREGATAQDHRQPTAGGDHLDRPCT
jgi:hypothetical protein